MSKSSAFGIPGAREWAVPEFARRLADRARSRPRAVQLEMLALVAVITIAATLRLYDLADLPGGMHGDEAVVGLEAQRILRSGNIGPYSPLAAGQPAGPIYLVALSMELFGHTLWAVRVVPAVAGIATIPLLYLVVRRSFDGTVALVSAALLATMGWHIHFARIGFPLECWPLVTVAATGALVEALRSAQVRWWLAAGALAGLGIYVYNGHLLFLALMALFVAGSALWPGRSTWQARLAGPAMFMGTLVVVAAPMLVWASNPTHQYKAHFERDTITSTAQWKQLDGPIQQARFVAERYGTFWERLSFEPHLDAVDGTGVTAIVPTLMLLTAAAGVILAIGRRKHGPLVLFSLLLVAGTPLASALTVDGLARRTFDIAPLIALFAAITLAEGVRLSVRWRPETRYGALGAAALLSGAIVFQNVYGYFGRFAGSGAEQWVFAKDLTDASAYMNSLPAESYVYFSSERWSQNYETRRFLAPTVRAEDRSERFGRQGLQVAWQNGRPVFVLLGSYMDELPQLQKLYPYGHIVRGGDGPRPTFIAYEVP